MRPDQEIVLDVMLAVALAVFVFAAAQLLSIAVRGGGL